MREKCVGMSLIFILLEISSRFNNNNMQKTRRREDESYPGGEGGASGVRDQRSGVRKNTRVWLLFML